jgi:broad specificity phosphatase PhoE
MPLPRTAFYMIRHGESVANLEERASGHQDVELTERGREQAKAARESFESLKPLPSVIIHSHLQRARITAEILNERLGLPMKEDRMIAEQHFGEWEGRPWTETRQPIRDAIDPPGGERHIDFYERIRDAITRHVTTEPGPVLFVCHGGVFRAIGGLYKHQIHGTNNCVLHRFEPEMEHVNSIFPWKVTAY